MIALPKQSKAQQNRVHISWDILYLPFDIVEWAEDITAVVSDQAWPVTFADLSTPPFIECGQYPGLPPSGETVNIECTSSLSVGRYVYLHQLETWMIMNVCEVEVSGCE